MRLVAVKSEQNFNKTLRQLYHICEQHGLYVPSLTDFDGNCLFNSLSYHNIGESVEDFRKGLAFIMYLFKDYKEMVPGDELTLSEKFDI